MKPDTISYCDLRYEACFIDHFVCLEFQIRNHGAIQLLVTIELNFYHNSVYSIITSFGANTFLVLSPVVD